MRNLEANIQEMQTQLVAYCENKKRLSLPPHFYTNKPWLTHEKEHLLETQWLCVGRVDEIPNPGDFFATELLSQPLIAVRDNTGEIAVLSNVCRHRNMQLAEGSGSCKHFICPYHAWSYHLDGRLLAAPLMNEQQSSDCDLPRYAVEIWQGFILVNLAGNCDPFSPQLQKLNTLLANFHCDQLQHVFVEEETWPANWKCLIENFMEGYHLSRVHPDTLGNRTPTRLCEKLGDGPGFTAYKANYPQNAPSRGIHHPDLSEDELAGSLLFCAFPALVCSVSSDVLVYLSLQPTDVDHVRLRWGMSVYDDKMPQDEIEQRVALWRQINSEDRAKLAKVQDALYSHHAHSGPLAPDDFEGTIYDFVRYFAKKLSI